MGFEVKLSGFQEINEIEKEKIKSNCLKFCEKQNRKLKNVEFIEMHLKGYEREGLRKKFSVHSVLGFSGTMLTSKAVEWNLIKAVDSSLKKIEAEINRRFSGRIKGKGKQKTQ
jgi:ribosome-associated translation inhibitor RaiA